MHQSGDDVEVRWEDQQKINTFGRLNTRSHDLEDDIRDKQSRSELLDDASNEIILADDDELIRRVSTRGVRSELHKRMAQGRGHTGGIAERIGPVYDVLPSQLTWGQAWQRWVAGWAKGLQPHHPSLPTC